MTKYFELEFYYVTNLSNRIQSKILNYLVYFKFISNTTKNITEKHVIKNEATKMNQVIRTSHFHIIHVHILRASGFGSNKEFSLHVTRRRPVMSGRIAHSLSLSLLPTSNVVSCFNKLASFSDGHCDS